MLAVLNRLKEGDKQTLGHLTLFEGVFKRGECYILELPDKDNEKRISRVCAGLYNVVPRWSEKYGDHFHVLDVDGRTLILIHVGNFYTETEGCLLAGSYITDIDSDGNLDVAGSKQALELLLALAPNGFKLLINDEVI